MVLKDFLLSLWTRGSSPRETSASLSFAGLTSESNSLSISLNGYTDLPSDKIVNIVTYLEMKAKPSGLQTRITLPRVWPSYEDYMAMFKRVGVPWLWMSSLRLTPAQIQAKIDNQDIEIYFLQDFGLLELHFTEGECEIYYFGLDNAHIAQGLGSKMMDFAIATAFAKPISRLWLHTCTLDHPKAVEFYIAKGFKPYKRAIEIDDDPRVLGLIDKSIGAYFPLIS